MELHRLLQRSNRGCCMRWVTWPVAYKNAVEIERALSVTNEFIVIRYNGNFESGRMPEQEAKNVVLHAAIKDCDLRLLTLVVLYTLTVFVVTMESN